MPLVLNRVERQSYRDSVALMRVSRAVAALGGVDAAALMIGSPSNKALMRDAGLLAAEGEQAGANDLVIAVRAKDAAAASAALEAATRLLSERESSAPGEALPRARTLGAALELLPQANLVLVSVPGEFAPLEARRALGRGLNCLVFSDNVPLDEELALKRLARDKGLLLMGPDCGSAILAGTPIAFANAVPRGDIGIVSASGTGLQEVSSLIARLGGGVSHGIGVGGRDLDARIGALGTLAAIEALDGDPATARIVLISKPPAPEVAARIFEFIAKIKKPFVVCFLGLREAALPKNVKLALTLTEAAELSLNKKLIFEKQEKNLPGKSGWARGLFCGGTLCAEAEMIFRGKGLRTGAGAHRFIDLGDDEYTRGRPHPMIEPELRNDHLKDALADASVAMVLVDVVLGYGSHPDPAGVLLKNDLSRKLVVASVTGTERDPQGYSRQVALLREAGVAVAPSNAHASAYAAKVASQCSPS
jgi:FdrA protein